MNLLKLILFIPFSFLIACSTAYEQAMEIDVKNPETFQQHLQYNYKQKASFEAEKMHDWNSAHLYSEKVLKAANGENIYPEKISYWKIPKDKTKDIESGYNNLLSIYKEAISLYPTNLAKAISSLDCWAEQEEEKWQIWDIRKCKDDFHSALHELYFHISNEKNKKEIIKKIYNIKK